MIGLFALADGDEGYQPYVDSDFSHRRVFRRRNILYDAREAGIPLAGLLADAECFDLAFERAMPPYRNSPDT